jgi:endogenous inhibitor of DNA gyrase (YacG/DUF329 family)
MAHTLRCPICKKEILPRARNPQFPFCSVRCRAVDLGKWVGEEYRVPEGEIEDREDELPAPASDDNVGHG